MIALLELGADVGPADAAAAAEARARASGTGRLPELVGWLAATQGRCPPRAPDRVRCLVVGEISDRLADLAAASAVGIRSVDLPDEPAAAFAAATACVDDEVDSGAELIVLAAADAGPAPATAVAVCTGAEPVALLPRGAAAIDTAAWVRQAVQLRDERRRVGVLHSRPDELLTALASPALAAATGIVLQCAVRRTPMVLDGTAALAAALLCLDVQARVAEWWQLADSADDPVHTRAASALGLRPLLDLGIGSGSGVAGVLAVAVLRAAAAHA